MYRNAGLPMTETYYEILGVSPGATTEEIETAYREKLKATHPDVSDDEDASDRTRAIIEAKEVLTDADERDRYDRLGHDRYVTDAVGDTDYTSGGAGSSGATSTGDEQSNGVGAAGTDSAGRANDGGTVGGRRHGTGPGTDTGRAPRDSWSDGGRATGDAEPHGQWRAWDTDAAYSLRDEGLHRGRLFTGQSVILLSATFVLFPVLLWGALLPSFPLVVNGVLACCLLGVVAYLQSLPEVAMLVFGAWSLLFPPVLGVLGLDLLAYPGAVVVLSGVLPFGLSVLTWVAVRN